MFCIEIRQPLLLTLVLILRTVQFTFQLLDSISHKDPFKVYNVLLFQTFTSNCVSKLGYFNLSLFLCV